MKLGKLCQGYIVRFKDLAVGDTFDFIGPDPKLNTFFARCTKISDLWYEWNNPLEPKKLLETRVRSIETQVYHAKLPS